MLDQATRTAILTLHQKGHGPRAIARTLKVSRTSVKRVLKRGTADRPASPRASQLDAHLETLRELVARCRDRRGQPNLVRVQEQLAEQLAQEGKRLQISYAALTRFCRRHGLGRDAPVPAQRIVTAPGEEMQHDTSLYTIPLGGKKVKRVCASLVLGYSRMLYLQFSPRFDRFQCKIFLTAAFQFFHGTCRRCVIDNTSVVIACGAGQRAQVAPELEAFEQRFGFHFLAHELRHSDRKGKVERPFDYIEGNFLVGRDFRDDADLNRQALAWLERANRRRMRELQASPVELLAAEQSHLVPLPLHVPEVYRLWPRSVDSYGCVSLHGLKYPVPAKALGQSVVVRETADRVIVLQGHEELAVHAKKVEGSPAPPPVGPAPAPRRSPATVLAEEGKLQALGDGMGAYLQALKLARGPRYLWSLKKLFRLSCQYKTEDLLAAVAQAGAHRLYDVTRLETILLQDIAARDYFLPLTAEPEAYEAWPQYQQGAATPEPDLRAYAPPEDPDA